MHKDGKPLRIIVSSLNSICSGAENYLKNILQNFLPECKYSIESTKKFKTWFMQERKKFEKSDYQIVTLDVVKLYPSVDIEFTLKHIIKKIYENPEIFFEELFDENENFIFPDKKIFKKFITEVLTKFTTFECLSGYYKQTYGCNTM